MVHHVSTLIVNLVSHATLYSSTPSRLSSDVFEDHTNVALSTLFYEQITDLGAVLRSRTPMGSR